LIHLVRCRRNRHLLATPNRSEGGSRRQIVQQKRIYSDRMDTCYMCDAPSTTAEHVPAKCLFPRGSKYRKNLIKVPSCDAHNSHKSKDDEYLRHVLVSAPGATALALKVADEGLVPSFERHPHIMKTFLNKARRVRIGSMETA